MSYICDKHCYIFREATKKVLFYWSDPFGLVVIGNIFFCLKSRKRILTIFSLHIFSIKRAIILRKYFKKPVKYCEFADRQHDTICTSILNIWICHLRQNISNFKMATNKKNTLKKLFFLIGPTTKKELFLRLPLVY